MEALGKTARSRRFSAWQVSGQIVQLQRLERGIEASNPVLQKRRQATHDDYCGGNQQEDDHGDGMNFDPFVPVSGIIGGGHDVSALEYLQLVVEGYGAHGDGESHEGKGNPSRSDCKHGCKQVELGPEADKRRNSRE